MSQHCGYVIKVKNLRPHSNADKLQLLDVFGTTTCVGLDVKVGDMLIYFPTDLQLSIEYCDANDLCRERADGSKGSGYLERNKRNIRAIRLRGERSDGMCMPLESLTFTGVDLSSLTEGTTIDVVNGVSICSKYIPYTPTVLPSRQNGNKTRKKKEPIAPLFAEHADTEQLPYNLAAFKSGDFVEITLKMHGCFIKGTKVRMADNSLKEIERIKIGDMVLGYDIASGKVVPTKVVHTFKNAPSSKWNRIKISRNDMRGDKRGTQMSTYNHKYWVEEKKDWVMAQDLKIGDTISTLFPSPVLTKQQKSFAIGSFLGDGCLLQFKNRTAEIQETKKKEHLEYLEYLSQLSSGWFYIGQEKISGYGSEVIVGRTTRSADLYNYCKDISTFNNGDQDIRLRNGIIEKITPLSIALWYCGDGSLSHSEGQQDRAALAICRYTQKEDREIIKQIFEKFNIYPVFYQDTKGYWRLRFNLEEANKLFELIAEYIPSCMQYKLPEKYKNSFKFQEDEEKYNPNGYVLSPQEVLENTAVNEVFDEYDLETELHNYIVGMSIVHNTSQRTAYLPVLSGYKRTILDRILRRQGTSIYKYDYVTGTRRTVLNDFDGGFYGSNAFRGPHAAFFEGKLHKGEEVFYEVVGYTDTGAPIMPQAANAKMNDPEFTKKYGETTTFSYGCTPNGKKTMYGKDEDGYFAIDFDHPQSDFYVYRMTSINEDGDVIEYTPEMMRMRCEEMGCKYVPLLWRGFIPEQEEINTLSFEGHDFTNTPGGYIQHIAEEFYDGADPIGKTHVREGVVVRIVNRRKFTAFKSKNYSFKVLEGLIKNSAEAPDMEEQEELC